MRVRFKLPDPRAGQVIAMTDSAARAAIKEGRAQEEVDREPSKVPAIKRASKPATRKTAAKKAPPARKAAASNVGEGSAD